jgi:RNA polymerase-binding protein DksA
MDKKQTDWFRAQLREQREHVVAEMAAHGDLSDPNEDRSPRDAGDTASQVSHRLVETRIIGDNGLLLRKIDFALQRLDAGTYDRCAHCGNEIPLERLRAKPSASLCLTCQKAKDDGLLPAA